MRAKTHAVRELGHAVCARIRVCAQRAHTGNYANTRDNAGSGSTGRRLRFERNSNSTERSYPRPKRTGIIITLLPISGETLETTGMGRSRRRRTKERGATGSEQGREKESDQDDARNEDTAEARRERESAGRAFRSRHPVYRSAVRDAGPMAWRSWQIIITNHQLFARNG